MKSSKTIIAISALLLPISALAAFQLYSGWRVQAEQIANYETFVSDLQSELDDVAQQRIAYESRIAELSRALASAEDAIRGLNKDLELAREQISPDIYLLEQDIRERVIREVVQYSEQDPTRYDVAKQLANLDPEEMRRIMSMQSRFGGFLSALDVTDERREVIVDALISQIADQDQQRRELIAQNAANEGSRRELRQQIFAISSPEAQAEALSYVLDDTEMSAFEVFQEERALQRQSSRSSFFGSNRGSQNTSSQNGSTTLRSSGQPN